MIPVGFHSGYKLCKPQIHHAQEPRSTVQGNKQETREKVLSSLLPCELLPNAG